jgi:hypothetical protein
MLPESKGDFPKCLYLDQNKWIDLARAHYGRPDGVHFQPCLDVIRAATASGKLVVPFSLWNAIEAMIPRDADRRKRLAEFMVGLSGNRTMAPEYVVAPAEIANATRQFFGARATEFPRKSLIQVGIIHAIGMGQELQGMLPPFLNAGFAAYMGSAEKTVEFLVDASANRDRVQAARDGEAKARDIFEADRAATGGMSLVARQRAELSGLFRENPGYGMALKEALQSIGRSGPEFKMEMGDDSKITQFVASIPNFDVFITLRIEREMDRDRKVEHNDIRDLDWLSVAVPYSNIVVAEQYWGRKIRTTGLAAKYGTVVLASLLDLPAQLSAMGCR